MNKKLEELYNDIPFEISSTIAMNESNQKIIINSGIFILPIENEFFEIEGEEWFDLLPHIKTKFKGIAKSATRLQTILRWENLSIAVCSSAEPASVLIQREQKFNIFSIFTTCQKSQPFTVPY